MFIVMCQVKCVFASVHVHHLSSSTYFIYHDKHILVTKIIFFQEIDVRLWGQITHINRIVPVNVSSLHNLQRMFTTFDSQIHAKGNNFAPLLFSTPSPMVLVQEGALPQSVFRMQRMLKEEEAWKNLQQKFNTCSSLDPALLCLECNRWLPKCPFHQSKNTHWHGLKMYCDGYQIK